jgi:hypothetical protein
LGDHGFWLYDRKSWHADKLRRTILTVSGDKSPETVFITSTHTGYENNSASQCAARKFQRISGARSPSSFALKPPGVFSALGFRPDVGRESFM